MFRVILWFSAERFMFSDNDQADFDRSDVIAVRGALFTFGLLESLWKVSQVAFSGQKHKTGVKLVSFACQ